MKAIILSATVRCVTFALALAAIFGYRCPAQGCPACKLVGK